ncbi:hypothetical protein KI387_014195 [Taxus chinensis]|uniref:PGG domain-containing protein n=1 Tax=Taxus chinensis TaxID=29808 RepID=A0AA38CMU7_TAXCH|nr:hypothetical protein KI387_014195 [Taxus chinensis]
MEKQLLRAAESDDTEELEKLLRGDADVFNETTPAKNTALHIAAYHGSKNFVEMLVELTKRADLEGGTRSIGSHGFLSKQNMQGNTALHEAASRGHAEIVEILVRQEEELASVTNRAGETAVFKAALGGKREAMEMFEKLLGARPLEMYKRKCDGQTPLHFAVFNKHPGIVEEILRHEPNLISEEDNLGMTPLHVAALIPPLKELVPPFHPWLYTRHANQIVYIAKMLLEQDRSLCYKLDKKSQCALHIAVKEGNGEMVKLILKYGGDCTELVDQEGRNALHLAVMNAEKIFDRNSEAITSILQSLVSASARLINDRDNEGKTALDIAILNMDKDEPLFFEIIKLLETKGALHNPNMAVEVDETKDIASKSKWRSEIISLNAVLIATVTFAAPFDLIGENILRNSSDLHSGPKYQRIFYVFMFYVFLISDTIAFGTSIGSAILLLFAIFGKKEDSPMVSN